MTILRHRRDSEGRSPPASASSGVHPRSSSISSASSTSSPPLSPSPAAGNMAGPANAPIASSPTALASTSSPLPPIPMDPHKKRHLRVPHIGRGSSNDEKHKKESEKKPTSASASRAVSAPVQSTSLRTPAVPFEIPRQTELVFQYNREGFVVPSTAEVYECDATVQTLAYSTPRPVLASEIFRCPSYTTAVPKNGRRRS